MNSSSDQYPEINISYRYDDNELDFIGHFADRQIARNQAKEIKNNIWVFEYGGRFLFYDKSNNELFYPEQLYAIYKGMNEYEDDELSINIDDLLKIMSKHPDSLKIVYDYYLEHRKEIDARILFI